MPAILPRPNLDYSDKDFEALKLRLQGLIRSVFPDWTDFNVANFGNILLELFCWIGDTVSYYQDAQARELFWPTVTQRVSAIRLGRLSSFKLRSPVAATVNLTFSTIGGAATVAIPIPAGTRVRSTDPTKPARFRTTAAGTIGVGASSVVVAAEQATLVTGETFISNGAPNQEYVAQQFPYLDSSATVIAGDGEYEEVTSFLDRDPVSGELIDASSKVYVVYIDQLDRAHFRFGNGKVGKIPQGTVSVTYKTGGGASGNVEVGLLRVLEDRIADSLGNPVTLTVTNAAAASGGVDRMSVAEARVLAPAALRALTRSVTKDDFEVNARRVAGVSRALMATSNEDSSVQENTGRLVVVARGTKLTSGRTAPATPSTDLLTAVSTMVTSTRPQTLTFQVTVEAVQFTTINVSTRVYLAAGYSATTVGNNIREALRDLFASELEDGTPNPQIDFGANIKDANGAVISEIVWSDVFNAVRDAAGVRKVDEGSDGLLLNTLRQSVTLSPRSFPILGTMTIVNAATGAAL